MSHMHNIKVAKKSGLTIKYINFSQLKDKILLMSKSYVVYEIPCQDCDKCCIDQTSRTMKRSIISHKVEFSQNTELTFHIFNEKHTLNYSSTKIAQCDNCPNKRSDLNHLSEFYSYLFYQF